MFMRISKSCLVTIFIFRAAVFQLGFDGDACHLGARVAGLRLSLDELQALARHEDPEVYPQADPRGALPPGR